MQKVKIKGKRIPIQWPVQTMQNRRSQQLTEVERAKLVVYDKEHGYVAGCEKSGLTKSTYFNILNNGFGRGANIEKVKLLLK